MTKLNSTQNLNQYIIDWCRQLGIKPRDLGCSTIITKDGKVRPYQNAHPAIDDVIILIKLRDTFWQYWNHNEKSIWTTHWNSVYHNGYPFKAKALKNIEKLATTGIFRQQQKIQQREKIRQLRESNNQIWGHNMMAKESPATTSLISG